MNTGCYLDYLRRTGMGFMVSLALTWGLVGRAQVPEVVAGASTPLANAFRDCYKQNLNENLGFQKELRALQGVQVLLIKGFFTSPLARSSRVAVGSYSLSHVSPDGTFSGLLGFLREHGVDAKLVQYSSEEPSEVNAEIIGQLIRGSRRPTFLVAHSKGGIDVLHALVSDPALATRVRGWVTLQTPFLGTPIADYSSSQDWYARIVSPLLERWGGTARSVQSLKSSVRQDFFKRHKSTIDVLMSTTHLFSVGTYKDPESGAFDSIYKPFRDIILSREQQKNDGIVTLSSAFIPQSRYVFMSGIDHATSVKNIPFSPKVNQTRLSMCALSQSLYAP